MSLPAPEHTADCPYDVQAVAMWHRWDRITFLHWRYEVDAVQSLLPRGLKVEPYRGAAWVGLVPFVMEVRSRGGRLLRWPFRFAETNVRTYVTGPDGTPGVWFSSLDASRLIAVAAARASYRVRYFWSDMSVTRDGDTMNYQARRRWPGPRGATSDVTVSIGDEFAPDELSGLDHYLTARWALFGSWGGGLLMARAQHAPWRLFHATAEWSDELIEAAGFAPPSGDPIVHWSPGVDVRIGYPSRA